MIFATNIYKSKKQLGGSIPSINRQSRWKISSSWSFISMMIFLIFLTMTGCIHSLFKTQEISKVTVAFSGFGCESECPFQALSIDNNLTAIFYGGEFADRKDFYKGKVSRATWDSIQTQFYKFIENGIKDADSKRTDHPEVEFYIHNGIQQNPIRFYKNTGDMTTDDKDVLYWFINIASKINLENSDSLAFETTYQYPVNIIE